MRRILATAAVAALALSTVAAGEEPAFVPDPVDVELFFHGDGERYVDDDASDPLAASYRTMDRTAPTGDDFESRQLLNYAAGPNPNCAGNYLLPVWTGYVGGGTVTGDATVTFDVVASGGLARVEVYTGVSGQACNESYVSPVAVAEVELPVGQGTVEATIDLDGFAPQFDMMVQLRAADGGPLSFDPSTQARVLFDGADHAASISFTCQPDPVDSEDALADPAATDCDPLT